LGTYRNHGVIVLWVYCLYYVGLYINNPPLFINLFSSPIYIVVGWWESNPQS